MSEVEESFISNSVSGTIVPPARPPSGWRRGVTTVYALVATPVFIGLFMMVGAVRLLKRRSDEDEEEDDSWSAPSWMKVLLTGGLFEPGHRKAETPGQRSDAYVLFLSGLAMQLSVVFPLYNVATSRHPGGDITLIAGLSAWYLIVAYHFFWIGAKFSSYSRRQMRLEFDLARMGERRRRRLARVGDILAQLDKGGSRWSLLLAPLGCAIGVVQVFMVRIVLNEGIHTYAASDWNVITDASSVMVLTAMNVVAYLGLASMYRQWLRMAAFVARGLDVADPTTADQSDVSSWALAWQHLLQDMRSSPIIRSYSSPSASLLVAEAVGAIIFFVLKELGTDNDFLHRFVPVITFLGIHAGVVLIGYMFVVVQLQKTIERQHRRTGQTQNDVQMFVDAAAAEGDDEELVQRLKAKVRVLQTLDRYLVAADPRPRFLGFSLETFRWVLIDASLLVINLCFLLLYIFFCYTNRQW